MHAHEGSGRSGSTALRIGTLGASARACVLGSALAFTSLPTLAQSSGGLMSDAQQASAPAAAGALYVVTPATPQRWIANQGTFLFVYQDPGGDSSRVSFLRRWAKDDRFDLAKRTQAAFLEAIASRGRLALPLAVSRPEQIEPSALSRDKVPETSLRGGIVDVAVEWFGVTAAGPFSKYEPFVRLSWRVLDSRGGVIEPTRVAYYNKVKGVDLPKAHGIDADPACAWKTMDEMAKDRPRLWACMNAGLVKLAEHAAESVVPNAPAANANR